jgi:hypothetical protein
VRFANENLNQELNSSLNKDLGKSDISQQEEKMFNDNMKMKKKKQSGSKKGKSFVETMQNIYNDLDQTLNEVELVNNETSLEENKVFKFEYQGLDAGAMEQGPILLESEKSIKEPKMDPEEILKTANKSGIDLQAFETKPEEQEEEEEIKGNLLDDIKEEMKPKTRERGIPIKLHFL